MRSTIKFAVAAAVAAAIAPASAGAAPTAPIDVILAIDGTASMKRSIEQAKREGEQLVERLGSVSADPRVAVAVFRDYRNPAGEYELLQPFTSDVAAVRTALGRVKTASNPDPQNSTSESYSLMFRKSYSDPAFAWRRGASRVLMVIGDAEPYGAGSTGLPGCRSKVPDPHGMNPAEELTRMRAAGIALLLLRQSSAETTADLSCYESLAERAGVGSAARDGGAEIVEPIVSLTKQTFAPLTLRPNLVRVQSGKNLKYVLTLTNRSAAPLRIAWLRAQLPRTLRLQSTTGQRPKRRLTSKFTLLVWHLNRTVAPGRGVRLTFTAKPTKLGRYRVTARGSARIQGGFAVDVQTRAGEVVAFR
jgi:von Willebrand factor type A domain